MSFYFIIFSTILTVLLGFFRYKFSYWEFQSVKQLKTHFLFGNFFQTRTVHFSELLQTVYDEFKGKAQLAGAYLFTKPIAVIIDLDLVKTILIKDFSNFVERSEYQNPENDPLTQSLFNVNGEKWRKLRSKLSQTFTSGKMKYMFSTVVKVAEQFHGAVENELKLSPDSTLEIYDFMGRYTTDVIGTCAFGIECNSLLNPDTEFRRYGKLIFRPKTLSPRTRLFKRVYANYLKQFGIRRLSRELDDFMIRVVSETVDLREKENIKRNDFMNLLIDLKNSKDAEGVPMLTLLEMVAQVFIFFAAGFETSSSNMSFGLYEMAKQPEIQDKVREEILQVLAKYDGIVTYEAMLEMSYLDQIITETLRKYPALASLSRFAGEDYKVPGTDITLEKGTNVLIPVVAIHYDADIYENPQEFRPERFNPEEIQKRHPQSFLGFGDGPRNCIGLRFGRMQVKIGLITLLKSFKFSICDKTPKSLRTSDSSNVLIPGEEVWLKVQKLE